MIVSCGSVWGVQVVQVACRWNLQYLTLSNVLIVNKLRRVCVRCKILGV